MRLSVNYKPLVTFVTAPSPSVTHLPSTTVVDSDSSSSAFVASRMALYKFDYYYCCCCCWPLFMKPFTHFIVKPRVEGLVDLVIVG